MKPIFETKLMGSYVRVFPFFIEYRKGFLSGKKTLMLDEIATVEQSMMGVQRVTLRTKHDKKFKLLVRMKDKELLCRAIMQAKSSA